MASVVYVDGENHYLRTEEAFKRLHGKEASIANAQKRRAVVGAAAYPDENDPIIESRADCFYFWDKHALDYLEKRLLPTVRRGLRAVESGVYATSVVGDMGAAHQARVWIRSRGFDPIVVHELRQARNQRENRGLAKAKTVDLALAVRILEDAYHGVYDLCYLFSSDLDFIPVIEAAKRLGKRVCVCGYRHAIGTLSDLEFVPDAFVDLTERLECYSEAGSLSS